VKENFTWIKLYRKLLDWEWYSENATRSVFIHLLLTANTEDKKWKGIDIKKGQVIIGRKELSKKLGLSEQSIRTALTHLKSTNEITSKQYSYCTLVTINNFSDYQQSTNKSTNNQPTINQQSTTTKEYKNKEYKKNTIESVSHDDIKEIAEKYQVSIAFVSKILEELKLYCGSTGKKYADYKLTLMNWVRRKTDEKPNSKLKDLEPNQILDIRNNPEKLLFYQRRGYDVSRLKLHA